MSRPQVHALFDRDTSTLTYVVWDEVTRDAVVIDSVVDFDPTTQIVSERGLGQLERCVADKKLHVHWILETHAHADHLTGGRELKRHWPGALWGMGRAMTVVFENFRKVFAWPDRLKLDQLGVIAGLPMGRSSRRAVFVCKRFRLPGTLRPA